MTQILALLAIEAYIAGTGALLWYLSQRRDSRRFRERILAYTDHES